MHEQTEPNGLPPVRICKTDGCERPALDKHGMYAGLCAGHRKEKQDARKAGSFQSAPEPTAHTGSPALTATYTPILDSNGVAAKARALADLLQEAEELRDQVRAAYASLGKALDA